MKFIYLLVFSAALAPPSWSARARPNPHFSSNRGPGPFLCDNGRRYELRGHVIYVDGIPALNYVNYEFRGSADGSGISVWENGFVRGSCELANAPPPPPPPRRYDNYVKVCDPGCHWETREVYGQVPVGGIRTIERSRKKCGVGSIPADQTCPFSPDATGWPRSYDNPYGRK